MPAVVRLSRCPWGDSGPGLPAYSCRMCSPSQRGAAWLGCFAGIDTAVLLSYAGQLGRVQSPNAIRMESTRLEHAGMTPHARTLAPCTDFADWGRGSPAPAAGRTAAGYFAISGVFGEPSMPGRSRDTRRRNPHAP